MSGVKSSEIELKRGVLNGQSGTYLNGQLIVQKNGVIRVKSIYVKRKRKSL